ncbi:MAG: sensor histidine kinase [Cyclobacteriaceae bacterium]
MSIKRWLVAVGFFLCTRASAQQFPIIKYGTEDGLGHSIVYRIHQDKKGFLWFSTDNGLTRYDGQVFRNFVAKDGLRSNFVFGIAENDSAMVVSTFGGGLQLTDGIQIDTIQKIAPSIRYPINITQRDTALWVVDRLANLHRVTRSGAKRYETSVQNTKHNIISQVANTSYGLVVSSYGLHVYNPITDRLEPIPGVQPNCYFQSVQELPNNRLLANYASGLVVLDMDTQTSRLVFQGNFSFGTKNIFICQDGTILAATTQGELWRLRADFTEKEKLLENVVVNDIAQDASGKIWLATYGQGVWCMPSFSCRFLTVQGLLNPSITFLNSRQSVFVTSINKGIFSIQDKRIEASHHGLEIFHKADHAITLLFEPNDSDEIIVGTSWGVRRKRGSQIDLIDTKKPISAFWKDKHGNYWAGLRMGLKLIDHSFRKAKDIPLFRDKIVRSLVEIKPGQLLVGTNEGLFRKVDSTWVRYGRTQGLFNEYVNVLLPDSARNLVWIATNEGIFQLLPNNQIAMVYNGIRCNSLLLDKNNHLWGGTAQGLLYFDGENYQLLSSEEGIEGNLFGVAYDRKKDELSVLSNIGITQVHVEKFVQQLILTPPRIIITEQILNGASVSLKSPLSALPSHTTSISLRIAIPYFRSQNLWQLYYKINEEEWQNAGDSRELNFVKLPFGNIKIQMQLRDPINKKYSDVVAIDYVISTPIYRTRTFLILSLVLFLIVSGGSFLMLLRYLDSRKQLKFARAQRQAELEQKVLRNMLNPHFMNNAVNSIQVFVTRNDPRTTVSSLAKFARLMRVNLELLENSLILLEKELQNIELYLEFEMLRFEGRLRYRVEVDPDVPIGKLKVPSLVLQPFVENAIWHGILPRPEGGEVLIKVTRTETGISIFVEDDGVGLAASQREKPADAEKPSRGLTLIRDRFEILNQRHPGHSFSLKTRDEQSVTNPGTVVHITLPMIE